MKQTENADTESPEVASEISPGVEERVQVTAFVDDQAVIPEHVPGETILPDMGTLQYTDTMRHSIISFLERPQLISCFSWKGMSTDFHGQNILCLQDPTDPNSRIMNPLVPSQVMTKMFIEKLQGFTAFRATAVFKLQINSQNFQAGRLIFGAVPMPTLLGERADFIVKTPCSALSVNHVQMDINKQTEVILRVPFISPFNSYDLINEQYDWASLFCIIYGPLNVVGDDNTLQCDLYCHFEDIELGCPTTAECKITPCVAPTRVVYWNETARSQSGNIDKINRIKQENELRELLKNKKLEKKRDRDRKYEQSYKLAYSQSGKVITKGKMLVAGWSESKEGEIEPDLTDVYWLDLWMASDTSRKVVISFNQKLVSHTLPGIDNILLFSGPYDFADEIKFHSNETHLIWQIFELEQVVANDNLICCNNSECSSSSRIPSRPITPPQTVPDVVNIPETFPNPSPWPEYFDSEMGPPRSQSGRGGSNVRSQRPSNNKNAKQVKQPRAPPKEAAPQKVKQIRVQESDGLFASRARTFGRQIGNIASSVGDAAASVFNWLGGGR